VVNDVEAATSGDRLLRVVGRRWALPVLEQLDGGSRRRALLERRLGGISPAELTSVIRSLVEAGLVSRHEVTPRRVEYAITRRGRDLLRPALAIRSLAAEPDSTS
jgi:DNA-binding HxlR family transcriptional regulator